MIPTSPSPSSYLSWPDAAHTLSYENVYNHLRLLDTYLLGQWSDLPSSPGNEDELGDVQSEDDGRDAKRANEREMAQARDEWLADALVALSICAEIEGGHSARKCMEIVFRVLVSLTHGDEAWGRRVVGNECALPFVARVIVHSSERMKRGSRFETEVKRKGKMKSEEESKEGKQGPGSDEEDLEGDGETQALDRLCLALGLLTNLVQVVESVKDLLRDIRTSDSFSIDLNLIAILGLDPACTLKKRVCIRQCTCSSKKASLSVLDVLVQLYIRQLPPIQVIKSETTPPADTSDASFLRGHLAVMFGLLMRSSPENQEQILEALNGTGAGASPRAKLNRLVDQARDFIAFYAALSSNPLDSDGPVDGNGAEGDRRREIDAERERESKIAKDVVTFLEGLRDGVEA